MLKTGSALMPCYHLVGIGNRINKPCSFQLLLAARCHAHTKKDIHMKRMKPLGGGATCHIKHHIAKQSNSGETVIAMPLIEVVAQPCVLHSLPVHTVLGIVNAQTSTHGQVFQAGSSHVCLKSQTNSIAEVAEWRVVCDVIGNKHIGHYIPPLGDTLAFGACLCWAFY